MFVDTHAHLTAVEFDVDRDDVIQRAADAGVQIIINPATSPADSRRALELADRHPGVFACVGIHPHEAGKTDEDALQQIEELSAYPKVVAIGEIGLDYFYNFAPPEVQRRVFEAQLGIAQRRNLPVVIHTRDSIHEAIPLVARAIERVPEWCTHRAPPQSRYPAARGVFHCFSGDVPQAWTLVAMGFAVSFPGILTFKNAAAASAVARSVSIEHLMLETDSPYMAPVPHRGTRNEPAHLPLIAARLAELQHLSVDDVALSTRYAAFKVFGVGELPAPEITYRLRDSLYVNLTIRCNADCVFCDRKGEAAIKGHNLRIEREPTVHEVLEQIGDPSRYAEIVFCGYGEPTIRLDVMKEIARKVKARGGKTRLNTDGHGNIINKRDIVPELVGLIDAVSISLNSPDPVQYGELMRLDGPRFYAAMIEFAKKCVKLLPNVSMTVVNLSMVDMEKARQIAEEEVGATFVKRLYF